MFPGLAYSFCYGILVLNFSILLFLNKPIILLVKITFIFKINNNTKFVFLFIGLNGDMHEKYLALHLAQGKRLLDAGLLCSCTEVEEYCR